MFHKNIKLILAGLLVVEGGLVGIIDTLLDAFRKEGIGAVDREVVADLAVAAEEIGRASCRERV